MTRILIVDDIALVGITIKRTFRKRRMFQTADDIIEVVETGAQACALHGNLHFDLAIIDVNLGDAKGPLLAVRLQEEWPVRVILMAGNPKESGWDGDVVEKPFDPDQFAALIRRKLSEPSPPLRLPRRG